MLVASPTIGAWLSTDLAVKLSVLMRITTW